MASTKAELEGVTDKTAKVQATPPSVPRRELPRATGWRVAPSGAGQPKLHIGTEQPRLLQGVRGEIQSKTL